MIPTDDRLTGIGEVVLLPLDVLKIKRQTNPESFHSRGFFRIILDENVKLYVVKMRIQNANFESKVGGVAIIRDMIRNEGLLAFFKGLTPKVLVVGPKLVFSFTLAQSLIPWFGKVCMLRDYS